MGNLSTRGLLSLNLTGLREFRGVGIAKAGLEKLQRPLFRGSSVNTLLGLSYVLRDEEHGSHCCKVDVFKN